MGDEDNIGEIDPERLARFMVKQLSAMPEDQRVDHLARLKEDMPLVHSMVLVSLNGHAPISVPPREESTGDGDNDKPSPEGRLSRAVSAYSNLVHTLRGGGVWASLAASLLLNCWLGWRIQTVNDRMVEVLMAVRFQDEVPARFSRNVILPAAEKPEEFDPSKVLAEAQEDYKHLVEQRVAAAQ